MTPTIDFLNHAERLIRLTLDKLRPQLLETQGNIEHHLKGDKSSVTKMDVLVEDTLRDALYKLDPGIAFSGEESGIDYGQKTLWLVDPIDGTEPFIRGLPFATTMITLIHDGQPVMGIINNFMLGDYYLAIQGKGATCNGHPIHVSARPLDGAFISMATMALDDKDDGQKAAGLYSNLRKLLGRNGNLFNVGATGYTMAAIASGAIDGRIAYRSRGAAWDYAPGVLLISEAGGRVANIGSNGYDYRNTDIIASNPIVFDDLTRFIQVSGV
jgi:myo-inositol-1(or 4)-monophosphatase